MNNITDQEKYIEKVKQINNGKELYYNILTMGCQLNENDSEKISGILEEMNYIKTEKMGRYRCSLGIRIIISDILIFNFQFE